MECVYLTMIGINSKRLTAPQIEYSEVEYEYKKLIVLLLRVFIIRILLLPKTERSFPCLTVFL